MARIPQVPLATAREYGFRAAVAGTTAAPLHGDCSDPVDRELRGVSPLYLKRLEALKDPFVDEYIENGQWRFLPGREPRPEPPQVHTAYVRVRCRKCPECLSYKRRLWTARGITEVKLSTRTWFGTLTVAPEYRFWATARASKRCEQHRAERWESLSELDQTRALADVIAPEITKWLKRIRKESKARIRYLLVTEPHGDGFPHFHLLIHEQGQPVTKRTLESQWGYGVSHWRLIPTGEVGKVGYVCKYLTKSAQTRIRASRNYGQPDNRLVTERLATLLGAIAPLQENVPVTKGVPLERGERKLISIF